MGTPEMASADVRIPCFSRVEIGNNVFVHKFQRDNSGKWEEKNEADKGNTKPHRGSNINDALDSFHEAQTWRNVMKSKAFRAQWNKSSNPDLTLSFREVDINGNLRP